MKQGACLAIALLSAMGCGGMPTETAARQQIVVTISDPGLIGGSPGGAPGPGYRRRLHYQPSFSAVQTARRIANSYRLTRTAQWPIRTLGVYCLVYAVPADVMVDDLLQALNARADVESAQALERFHVLDESGAAGDPYRELQHTVDTLELTQAHAWSTGNGAHVTIIDTGADITHPEFRSQVDEHVDFVGGGTAFEFDRHGTAIAGVIAAAAGNGIGIVGVAPAARLSILKACWHTSDGAAECNTFTLARALGHAIESGTDIINLSLAGPPDPLLRRLTVAALDDGIVVVAAAPAEMPPGFPASVAGVLVVDAGDQAARVSRARRFPLAAPGVDILVPRPRGGFDYSSGSSLAAAQVSGIVALLRARQPLLPASDIRTLLMLSRSSYANSVNACRALAELLSESGCRPVQAAAAGH